MPQVLGEEILKIDFGRNSEAKTGNLGVHLQSQAKISFRNSICKWQIHNDVLKETKGMLGIFQIQIKKTLVLSFWMVLSVFREEMTVYRLEVS